MKLQILVPQYNEDDAILKGLLDSIAMQRGVDFNEIGVVIVNDGSDVLISRELLQSYPFEIEYWLGDHAGVSAARNCCLGVAAADYVMFCDADDAFYSSLGLWMIFKDMEDGFDVLISRFMEECRHPLTGEMVYVSHSNDSTFVHGKVFRFRFLEENEILWDPELTIHEDSYFNLLCRAVSKKTKYCDVPFYMWQWRKDSVARSDGKYMLKTYPMLLDSNAALIRELLRRELRDDAVRMTASAVTDMYYAMQQTEWLEEQNAPYRDAAEKKLAALWPEWEPLFREIDPADFMELSEAARRRHIAEGMGMERQTMREWMQEVLLPDKQ